MTIPPPRAPENRIDYSEGLGREKPRGRDSMDDRRFSHHSTDMQVKLGQGEIPADGVCSLGYSRLPRIETELRLGLRGVLAEVIPKLTAGRDLELANGFVDPLFPICAIFGQALAMCGHHPRIELFAGESM